MYRRRGVPTQGAAKRPATDVVAQHVEIEARFGAPVTGGGEGRRDTYGEVFSFPAVDGSGSDPYTPVHRRAANGVGGLLLHLLTIGGVWAWGSGRALLFCCVWVLFFDK